MKNENKVTVRPDAQEITTTPVLPKVAEPKNKEPKPDKYTIGTIATQTAEVILEADTQEPIEINTALVLILNKLDKIERTLG